jgi:hypothetical protein
MEEVIMDHSGADGDPPLNGYEPNAQTDGPGTVGVAGNEPVDDGLGSSDCEDKISEYMWNYVITDADQDKLTECSLKWVSKAISGLRQECSTTCIEVEQLREKIIESRNAVPF